MAMGEELRRKTLEGWEKAKAEKAERRASNRKAWAERRKDWSDDRTHKVEIPAEAIGATGGSASLQKLRRVMADPKTVLYRRIEAAEVILNYEISPAGAVGLDPDFIAASSYRFLRQVADDPGTPDNLRFRCLKAIVTIENARVQVRNTGEQVHQKRELQLQLVNAERRRELAAAGVWESVVHTGARWALEADDQFDWLPGWPGGWTWPLDGFSADYRGGGDAERFRRQLRQVRARNRVDDWEALLPVAAT
jgi:hypothetical protein